MAMSAISFDSVFGIVATIGPFILLGVLAYAVLNWRGRSRAEFAKGEQRARDLYTDERARNDKLEGEKRSGLPPGPAPPD
jgi:hypothetical protein